MKRRGSLCWSCPARGFSRLPERRRLLYTERRFQRDVTLAPLADTRLVLPLGSVFDRLSPGSVPVQVELAGRTETAQAVNWQLGDDVQKRMRPIDLSAVQRRDGTPFQPANAMADRLHRRTARRGPAAPDALRDERGFVIMNGLLSLFEYGVLPEQIITAKYIKFDRPLQPSSIAGVPFRTLPGKIMAVCCTEPYQQFPSRVVLRLPEPMPAVKALSAFRQPGKNIEMLLSGEGGPCPLCRRHGTVLHPDAALFDAERGGEHLSRRACRSRRQVDREGEHASRHWLLLLGHRHRAGRQQVAGFHRVRVRGDGNAFGSRRPDRFGS